ncbi:zinc finger protein interacting with ribonucleoprotein K-like [Dreissena polymorpha]|uniref:C2H2-type domain-containing protein n=1 Tax=Dreissena polymorpha TaxID=45954 RepID=A0A9D4NM57_DREPO|nr:zinc finger protein interacting with ribonucleoprotein K-like [Dreissena polymorpha]XP_052260287.1 zinc finger protein interacting with ribonucleoprotein K-like [Dreissena polymorpha]XP_052260288.1 zinc finger protein interacting with ribonucleoprotein K-like [Dreissena polymorpha]XP_052260289.1 zinc finger protein interacting with ribonucleoprotein K-like [Dreissena polymorpha]XP_052260290.1 zinc finger protein interacting with ribonucleoprotein K-like [Dreissena polymorpha]XP_052260291.1 
MVGIDMDVIGDLPGYKFILKAVLKAQIQQLIDQLAACTDEESVILTASVSDGSLSHLGSESGKSFLQENDDVKSKFLGYCLKSFHVKAQQERIQPLPSYRLVHQSRQTHHHVGATRANTCTFQRHQPYPSNRKAFKLASDSPVVPLAIVANTARDSKAFASATEGAELDEDAGTVSLDSEEQSDANESHFPKNDIQSNNTTKVDGHLVKEDNSAGEEGDNNDSVVGVRVKIESGVDYKQDSGWDPDESIDLGQYSTEASGSSTGQVMENPMAHHNMEDDNFFESENVPHEDDNDASLLDKSSMEVSRKEEALAKKYECRVCGKTFKYKSTLKRHMNVHDTNAAGAQYKCGSCTLFFYGETQLLQHKTDKHASHLCVQCGKTFFFQIFT